MTEPGRSGVPWSAAGCCRCEMTVVRQLAEADTLDGRIAARALGDDIGQTEDLAQPKVRTWCGHGVDVCQFWQLNSR
jgi:hypothetical protein